MDRRRDQRGLSNSVQYAPLLPVTFAVLLAVLQWAFLYWAEAPALAAAQEGAAVASVLDGSAAAGEGAAARAADTGGLSAILVDVERGPGETRATVSGRAVSLLWPREVSKTVVVATERLS